MIPSSDTMYIASPDPCELTNICAANQVFGQNKHNSWTLPKALRIARPPKALLEIYILTLLHL